MPTIITAKKYSQKTGIPRDTVILYIKKRKFVGYPVGKRWMVDVTRTENKLRREFDDLMNPESGKSGKRSNRKSHETENPFYLSKP